jgi:hypothetical protein
MSGARLRAASVLLACVAGACAAGACTAFSEEDAAVTPPGPSTDGSDDAAGPDGASSDPPSMDDPEMDSGGATDAPLDSGAADVTATDAEAGNPVKACPLNAFCDSFERATLGTAWKDTSDNGTAATQSNSGFRGSFSLKVHLNNTAAGAIKSAGAQHVEAYSGATMYMRAFVYLPKPAPADTVAFMTAQNSPGKGIELTLVNGAIATNAYGTPPGQSISTTKLPVAAWTCLEWSVGNTGTAGDVHVWMNDAEVVGAKLIGVGLAPVSSVNLGFAFYMPASSIAATDIWFDDVIIRTTKIGCTL